MIRPLLIATLLASGCAASQADTRLDDARTSLKNYGLTRCLLQALPADDSALRKDLSSASSAYHAMGRGAHVILQDEETLDTLHDPYQQTIDFVTRRYAGTEANMKAGTGKNVFHACLTIYHSADYEQFIRTQDPYVQ